MAKEDTSPCQPFMEKFSFSIIFDYKTQNPIQFLLRQNLTCYTVGTKVFAPENKQNLTVKIK